MLSDYVRQSVYALVIACVGICIVLPDGTGPVKDSADIAAGFVWNRAGDWTVRPDSDHNTMNGNPDDDSLGNPVWRYEHITGGGGLGSVDEWYRRPALNQR